MSRKQKALEERFRKPSQFKNVPSHEQLCVMRELTEKRRLAEHWEKTRPCTLEDIERYFETIYLRGFWTGFSDSLPNWQKERDDILSSAYRKAEAEYTRPTHLTPWEIDSKWDTLYKNFAEKEWKLRQTKLYRALK